MRNVVLNLVLFPLWIGLLAPSADACPCHGQTLTADQWKAFQQSYKSASPSKVESMRKPASSQMPLLPFAEGLGTQSPWGGSGRWRAEAVLANATSEALNQAWALPDTRDAVVAVPVKMLRSAYRPYGDGQSNASVAFGAWDQRRPQLVSTLITRTHGSQILVLKFDRGLQLAERPIQIQYRIGSSVQNAQIAAKKDTRGDLRAEWEVLPQMGWKSSTQSNVVFVRPAGWQDWFALSFRHPVGKIANLLAMLPQSMQKLRDGRPILDSQGVSQLRPGVNQIPFEALIKNKFSDGYNPLPFTPQNIHAEFPNQGGITTSVGQGWTWVVEKPAAPFKILYTCFERRRPDHEAAAKDGGVPSGGGWHEIGDYAETLFNSLEREPIVVGFATTPIAPRAPSGNLSYGLTDIATIRFLQPGEAMLTEHGPGSWGYDQGKPAAIQANFHWFFFHHAREVCTEEWVHPCSPSVANRGGLSCGG